MTSSTSPPADTSEQFWDDLYRKHIRIGTGRVNPVLAEVAGPLSPRTALDLGCGEGSDSLWLAAQGWQVTAADVSAVVLARARSLVDEEGLTDRVDFQRHDLAATFPAGRFELVAAQYFHTPLDFPRARVLRTAADAVAPDGVLLIVDHGSLAPWSSADHDITFPTPEVALAALELDLSQWEVLRLEAPQRLATGPGGQTATVTDTVLTLRRTAG